MGPNLPCIACHSYFLFFIFFLEFSLPVITDTCEASRVLFLIVDWTAKQIGVESDVKIFLEEQLEIVLDKEQKEH